LAPFPYSTDHDVRAAVQTYPAGRLGALAQASDPGNSGIFLAIKYISARDAKYYSGGAGQFNISDTAGFTWGRGTYVAPLAYPTSSAIFGRVGVVGQFVPKGWKVFDATDVKNQDLYLAWAWRQPSHPRLSMLTMGSAYYNHWLRNRFRQEFEIDCVLFPPDQVNNQYTKPTDVWMCVTDWTPGKQINDGLSDRFTYLKSCVLVDEEFDDVDGGITRNALINPGGRTMISDAARAAEIAIRYFGGTDWVRVEA
jgi:hypothetical protein